MEIKFSCKSGKFGKVDVTNIQFKTNEKDCEEVNIVDTDLKLITFTAK